MHNVEKYSYIGALESLRSMKVGQLFGGENVG